MAIGDTLVKKKRAIDGTSLGGEEIHLWVISIYDKTITKIK